MNFERIRVHILQSCFILFKKNWSSRKFDKIFLSFVYVYLYFYLFSYDILKEIIIIELFP